MNDYDFKTLNDKEFEVFCADLLGAVNGVRIERFKPGKDGGVDGRYFATDNKEIILQCKHWANTPTTNLIRHLKTVERPKLDKLKPNHYQLAISNSLSRNDKGAIAKALGCHLKSESDIFGKEDLNDLLKKHAEIEKRYYKLWLCSTSVMSHILNKPIFERSTFTLKETLANANRYVLTLNHERAISKLEKLGVVILSGEPGIGKTTLAENICLRYVNEGFEFVKIEDDIKEAEAVLEEDKKQIFYFDDFLGRNYFEALNGRASSRVVGFIRRVVSDKKFKRFILTSRSTVLNQGKVLVDCFQHQNLDRNEFELTVSALSDMEKAMILYNHIWHTNLPPDYVEELYKEKRYRKVIAHKNFNPRLINFITDFTKLENVSSKDFWACIEKTLKNPADVWDNPFVAQQDDFGRAIILLVTLNRKPIAESELATAYNRYLGFPEHVTLHGRRDFLTNIRYLSGSLLNRQLTTDVSARLDLFNPSLGDYVLNRYVRDVPTLKIAMLSLRSVTSLQTLLNLRANNMLDSSSFISILESIIVEAFSVQFVGYDPEYISKAALVLVKGRNFSHIKAEIEEAVLFVMNEELPTEYEDVIGLILWALQNKVASTDLIKVFKSACDVGLEHSSLMVLAELLPFLDTTTSDGNNAKFDYDNLVVDYVSDTIEDEAYELELFHDVDYNDDSYALQKVKELIKTMLNRYGLACSRTEVDQVLHYYDYSRQLMKYHENAFENSCSSILDSSFVQAADGIDDLFDRG